MATCIFLEMTKDTILGDDGRLRYLTDLVKAGVRANEMDIKNKDILMIQEYQAYGVAGLVLLDLEKMSKTTSIIPILLLILKGNVSVVISTSQGGSSMFSSLESVCNLVLPPGVVQFVHSPSLFHAVHGLSGQGKVQLLWIVHAGTTLPRDDEIPNSSFVKVVVDHVESLEKCFLSRSKDLEISKTVYL